MKRQIITCLPLLCLCLHIQAQPYKISVPSGAKELEIIISNTRLAIEGYNGNEILITSKVNSRHDQRAEGLRALYQVAEDNTGLGLNLEKSDNQIRLLKVSRKKEGNFLLQIPRKLDLVIKEEEWHGEDISISNMAGAITIHSNNSDLELENVAGPVRAKTTSGDIFADFSAGEKIQPSEISSISGTVDIYLPRNLSADLDISSISGEIFSDFDFEYPDKSQHRGLEKIGGGRKTKATINGGGTQLVFSSISDDVYVRKGPSK